METTDNQNPVVSGNTRFALDAYGKLRAGDGNRFFSPYSISCALAMTYAGARGETAREMGKTLHLLEGDATHKAFRALILKADAAGQAAPAYQLVVANALWLQQGDAFLPGFLGLVRDDYHAGLFDVDFHDPGNRDATRRRINDWVAQQTRDKIRDLVGKGTLTNRTSLVLTNAIYFKAEWQYPFREYLTNQNDVFQTADGRKVPAAMMHHPAPSRLKYAETDAFQMVELPYVGGAIAMDVILPKKVDGLNAIEGGLDEARLSQIVKSAAPKLVNVELPRFRVEASFELSAALQSLGMRKAFDAGVADFSGISGSRELAISAVIHKAFVDVTEKGTEAAAATAVMAAGMAMRPAPEVPVRFRADHPFLFLIRDTRDGSILFLGRLAEPPR